MNLNIHHVLEIKKTIPTKLDTDTWVSTLKIKTLECFFEIDLYSDKDRDSDSLRIVTEKK